MHKLRLLVWMIVCLFVFVACTPSEAIEEPAAIETTQPTATAVSIEPTVMATATEPTTDAEPEALPTAALADQATPTP